MQNYCKTIGALAAASAFAAGNASAEIEYEIHTGYSTEYIFRGIELGDDLVETGVNMATEMNGLGLSAGAWYGSFESVDGLGDSIDIDELDLYGEVSKDLGYFTAAIGYIYYINMGSDNTAFFGPGTADQQELYFSVAKSYYGFDVSLTYFWDVETDNNGYSELGIGRGFELSPCLTLNTGVALAYLWEQSDFAHVTAKVSLDWAFTETATLSPYIAAAWGLDDGYTSDDEFFAGSMLSVSF